MTSDTARLDEPLRGAGPWRATARFWQRILVFSGRASLSEFWWPVLVIAVALVVGLVLVAVLLAIGSALQDAGSTAAAIPNSLAGVLGAVLVLASLAAVLAGTAVTVRRLHDADLSGWLALTALIPSVGGLVVLVLSLLPANPRGRRYDRDAGPATDPVEQRQPLPAGGAASTSPFDVWPAPDAHTAAAPVIDVAPPADAALRDAWAAVGAVHDVEPGMTAPPAWRRQRYLAVERAGAPDVLATDGLHASEGTAALGVGAELFVIGDGLAREAADRWELALLASAARRVRAGGMHLPADLEQYGTLSMTLPDVPAPEGWARQDGAVGVLLGLPFPAAPDAVATASGEVELVCVTPLRPAELQQILDGGAAARARIAGRLAAMPSAALADRP